MLCFPRGVVLACVLLVASCSKDSTKIAEEPPHDMSPLVRAFAALVSPRSEADSCLSRGECRTSSARLRTGSPARRSVGVQTSEPIASASVLAAAGTSASSAYTIISDPEDFSAVSELVNVLNGDGLRVLPVVGLSALTHLDDVARHGVDLAIVPVNTLRFKAEVEERSGKRISHIGRAYDEALHILASREITNVRQLDGRKVNIGPAGSGGEMAAHALFSALGIQPVLSTDNVGTARQRLQSGDIAAAVFLTPRPTHEVAEFSPANFVHLLPIEHNLLEGDAYEAAWLEASHYPAMIESGARIPTVTVPNVVVVMDASAGSRQHTRISRFAREYGARTTRLHQPGRPGPWQPTADVPGWTRFRPAEARPTSAALSRSSAAR
jgi:hypothetical protein